MSKTILAITVFTFLSGAMLSGCSTSAEKVEDAKENLAEANKNLENAKTAYLLDVEHFKKETADKINANERSVEEFNKRIEGEKQVANADYKKKILALERKNSDMKKKMDDYKADSKENWEKFKTEFNHDLDALGEAFKNLTVNSTK